MPNGKDGGDEEMNTSSCAKIQDIAEQDLAEKYPRVHCTWPQYELITIIC